MTPEQFQFASSGLEDSRKLIATGKAQRWEVTKWAVGLNIALATASVAIDREPAAWLIFIFTGLIGVMAALLILNYTKRMTGARNDAVHVYQYLTNAGVPCVDIFGKDVTARRTSTHDWIEMCLLIGIVALSLAPAWVAAVEIPLEEAPSQQTTH
jgi:hypothetical protein